MKLLVTFEADINLNEDMIADIEVLSLGEMATAISPWGMIGGPVIDIQRATDDAPGLNENACPKPHPNPAS